MDIRIDLPPTFDAKDFFNNVDISVVNFICIHDYDKHIYFRRRYDCRWFFKNKNKKNITAEKFEIIGFIGDANFVIDIRNRTLKFEAKVDKKIIDVSNCAITDAQLRSVFGQVDIKKKVVGAKILLKDDKKIFKLDYQNIVFVKPYRFELLNEFMYASNIERKITYVIKEEDGVAHIAKISKNKDADVEEMKAIVDISGKIYLEEKTKAETDLGHRKYSDTRVWYPGVLRHCAVKPICVKKPEQYFNDAHYIMYPKDNPFHYKAQEGYFIGLKINKIPPREGKSLAAFPICFKTNQLEGNTVLRKYLDSNTDEEFYELVKDKIVIEKTRKLIPFHKYGSIYEPIKSIVGDGCKHGYRIRVSSWQILAHIEDVTPLEHERCLENFHLLGYECGATLKEYYLEEPLHDIRITYNLFESRLGANINIFVRSNLEIKRFAKNSDNGYAKNVIIIIYEENEEIQGYEVIKKGDTFLLDN